MSVCNSAPACAETDVLVTPKQWLGEFVNKIETSRTQRVKRHGKLRKKVRAALREHVRVAKAKGLYAVCLTLTYKKAEDFSQKNITKLINALRMKLARRRHKLPYIWVLERTPTVLHYHFILWLPRGFKLDTLDLTKWWAHGSTWVEACKKVRA